MSAPTLVQTARDVLDQRMAVDPSVIILGEDVAAGGPFGLTKGLVESYGPGRVRNTPISEGAVLGAAIGLALAGQRPLVDLMFCDFLTVASDQLVNHAAKLHFMSGGRVSVPLTIWTVAGAGTRWGAQHSQHLEGWAAEVPGLKVLAPASPADAASALLEALDDPDPVLVVADRSLLYQRTELAGSGADPWSSRVVQPGNDATVVATGRLVHVALAAAQATGASVEVVYAPCLAPLAIDAAVTSATRTSRALVLSDEAGPGTVASQIAATLATRAFWDLDAPVMIATCGATPIPAAPNLEDAWLLGVDDVSAAIKALVAT